MKRQSIFTPDILALSFKVRRHLYGLYLQDLLAVNEAEFSKAADV